MAEVLIGYTNFSLQHLFLDQATLGVGQRNVSQSDVSLCLANVNSIANIFKTENTWLKFHSRMHTRTDFELETSVKIDQESVKKLNKNL